MKELTKLELLAEYHRARKELVMFSNRVFPLHQKVRFTTGNYSGTGVVVRDFECPIHWIPLKTKNEDVEYFDMADCEPI